MSGCEHLQLFLSQQSGSQKLAALQRAIRTTSVQPARASTTLLLAVFDTILVTCDRPSLAVWAAVFIPRLLLRHALQRSSLCQWVIRMLVGVMGVQVHLLNAYMALHPCMHPCQRVDLSQIRVDQALGSPCLELASL